MSRRFLFAAVALAVCLPAAASAGRHKPRNVVLVVIDALRPDHVGAYGYRRDTTPNLDRLAREGVLFREAIAQSNWTLPSVASIMTSLYPSVHGARTFPRDPNWGEKAEAGKLAAGPGERLDARWPTLAATLRRGGLATYGATANALLAPAFGFNRGFDRYFQRFATWAELNDKTIFPWLSKAAERPFFLFVQPVDVHDPYGMYGMIAPYDKRWVSDYRGAIDGSRKTMDAINQGKLKPSAADIQQLRDLYDGGVSYADAQLGRLVAELERLAVLEETLIIVTADHGDGFLEHARVGHVNSPYDEVLKVPLIVRWPKGPRGRTIDAQASGIDIFPTILDALALAAPPGLQGRSLVPLIEGGKKEDRIAFSEPTAAGAHAAAAVEVVRTRQWKLIRFPDRRELYRLEKDPGESRDLQSPEPELTAGLEKRLDAWRLENRRRRAAAGSSSPPPATLDPGTLKELKAAGYLE